MAALVPRLAPQASRASLTSAAKASGLEVVDKGDEGVYNGEVLFRFAGGKISSVTVD